MEQYFADGIAVATISDRYGSSTVDLARSTLTPNGECDGMIHPGCQNDVIFRGEAHAIYTLRYLIHRAADLFFAETLHMSAT